MQDQQNALALRCSVLEMRIAEVERSQSWVRFVVYMLAGLVFAAIIVCAFELRAIYNAVEAKQWQSH